MYKQVVSSLAEFDPKLRLAGLTRERLAQYVAWLFADGKRESTVQRHYIFLRECHRMVGRVVPKWLGKEELQSICTSRAGGETNRGQN